MTLVTSPAKQVPPFSNSADPEFSALSLAPIPPVMGNDTDASRQFYRQSVSQIRMPPLPAASKIAQGAQAATQVIYQVSGGGSNTNASSPTGVDIQTNNVDNPIQSILNITGPGVSYGPSRGEVAIAPAIGDVQNNGVAKPHEPILNFLSPLVVTDNPGNTSSDVSISLGTIFYQTMKQATVAKPQEPALNFAAPFILSDNAGVATNVTMPVMQPSGVGHASGLVGDPGASAGSTRYWREDGTFAIPPGTGGTAFYQTIQTAAVSAPQEPRLNFLSPFTVTDNPGNTSTDIGITLPTPAAVGADAYCPPNPIFSTSTSTLANKTIIALLPAAFLKNGGNSIRIGMQATSGTTIQIGQMSLFKCAAGSTTVLTTTGVNIGGNSTPIVNFPGTVYTDAIPVVIDGTHDYYFGVYITSGGLLACTGTTYAGSAAWPFASQQFSGNNLSLTTVPSMTSTTTLIWSAVIAS